MLETLGPMAAAVVVALISASGALMASKLNRRPAVDRADYAERIVNASAQMFDRLEAQRDDAQRRAELAEEARRECLDRLAALGRGGPDR